MSNSCRLICYNVKFISFYMSASQASVLQVWSEKGAKGPEAMEEAMHVAMLLAKVTLPRMAPG